VFRSGGVLVKSSLFTPLSWNGIPQPGITTAARWNSYDAIYRSNLWVAALVNKIANASARLPLKVYAREEDGRPEARNHPYARLLRRPSTVHDPFMFWLWTVSTLNVYGEVFWLKGRDRNGTPVELYPMHPTRMQLSEEGKWTYDTKGERTPVARRDFVHFRFYDPCSQQRGMSPLEPLRSTLENEWGARTANSALWANGARPSVVLNHPGKLSQDAATRLADSWASIHGGAHNFAKTAVLEEGMSAQVISLNAEDLQYVETRKLNREEVCAAYDVPPPVVHILDRATFSNITEQMRSMYRDTMAPKLKLLESTLEMELRDGSFGKGDPDFGDEVYAEFLMDEVLRGSFEARAASYQQGIQSGWIMPSEVRQAENLPFVDGSDQLFINSAVVPIDQAERAPLPAMPPGDDRSADPVIRRHLNGINARLAELDGGS
jgi:HK97 family phage portal protein